MDLKKHIRSIPDFPKSGILFYDISTLLAHPSAWKFTVERLSAIIKGYNPDILVGIESRGFIIAAPLALTLGIGFVMIRSRLLCVTSFWRFGGCVEMFFVRIRVDIANESLCL